jgi:predicted DNA-binding transcriptional regulator AlpA
MTSAEATDYALLRDVDAASTLAISRATFWRRVADGTIPKPIRIGGASRWTKAEILGVIEAAQAVRAGDEPHSSANSEPRRPVDRKAPRDG